ncbi:sucrase-isomaltase, intestinal [Nematostella vectensis]|uniref:sucrase-isomaltase, intestinal n=1 Tax=Nematostella vectensis TaxID=45351 RepID=UPI00207757B8|nr:sucrase-isomaltase, intestinal [Nematostella vectensis]
MNPCFAYSALLCLLLALSVVAVHDEAKFDCYPEHGNETLCRDRGCTWEQSANKGVPWCYYPEGFGGYKMVGQPVSTSYGQEITLKRRTSPSVYGGDIETLKLVIEWQSDKRLRFKFYDPQSPRYEVPIKMPNATKKAESTDYEVRVAQADPFALQITRKSTRTVIWDSSVGSFIFSDQFLQISTKTPSKYVYGFGEQEHSSFRHDMSWRTWPLFTRDQFPFDGGNAYGHHAFHVGMEEDGNAHGIFLLNSNAMEIALQPLPAITYRTIGGILDFYVFLGPSPESVIEQYTEAIGRTFMPPYWSLGFMLSRWGYNSLKRVQDVVESMRKYDIPQDVQFGDIDYMVRQLDFTYNKDNFTKLPEWVRSVKKDGLRYIIILDPAIGANETAPYRPYDLGNQMDIWVKDMYNKTLFGKVWPTYEDVNVNGSLSWDKQTELYRQWAAFPDFFHPRIKDYWGILVKEFHAIIEFDGLWIDMNEPANFVTGTVYGCPNSKYDYPPYKPKSVYGAVLADKTLCMSGRHSTGLHYDLHSLYGMQQSIITQKVNRETLIGKRSMVFSRSTFAGTGAYAGHWLGDNVARWDQLHASIIGMLEFNMFGIPYIGADICGFFDNPSPELCQRWTQLGAFYPFSRNHNGFGNKAQDPASFGAEFATAARDVLRTRYTLLPYLYTLFYQSRKTGATVVRSLLAEFTSDKNTWVIDRQFMWGGGLLISPVLDQGKVDVKAYVPDARWYDFKTGEEVPKESRKKTVTWDAPIDHIPVHVRGGHVIPTQEPANNTMFSRKNNMGIIVALDENNEARGELFWDDGESVDTYEKGDYLLVKFLCKKNALNITAVTKGYNTKLVWGKVLVYGIYGNRLDAATVNGNDVTNTKTTFSQKYQMMNISGLSLGITDSHLVTWKTHSVTASAPSIASFAVIATLLTMMIAVFAI